MQPRRGKIRMRSWSAAALFGELRTGFDATKYAAPIGVRAARAYVGRSASFQYRCGAIAHPSPGAPLDNGVCVNRKKIYENDKCETPGPFNKIVGNGVIYSHAL